MSRIGIDARLISQTGVGSYTRSLLEYLEHLINPDDVLYVFVQSVKKSPYHPNRKNIQLVEADYSWHSIAEQTGFLQKLVTYRLDLMHFTYFSFPMLYPASFIITIHDLIPLFFSTGKASTKHPLMYRAKHIAYRLLMRVATARAYRIIVPSQTVKNDIERYYGRKVSSKVEVTYEGVPSRLMHAQSSSHIKKVFKKPFFIYVGNFYPHKNIEMLVRAFRDVLKDYDLALIGPDDYFSQHIRSLIKSLNMDQRVIMLVNSSDEDLSFLYSHAQALIHPSLSEGFGLPLLEASYFKCPILASNIPIIQEILGDYFIPFDPLSKDSITTAINRFVHKPEKKFLPLNILQEKFSFEKMSYQTYEIYKKTLFKGH